MLAPAFLTAVTRKKVASSVFGQLWRKVLEGGVCSSDTKGFSSGAAFLNIYQFRLEDNNIKITTQRHLT